MPGRSKKDMECIGCYTLCGNMVDMLMVCADIWMSVVDIMSLIQMGKEVIKKGHDIIVAVFDDWPYGQGTACAWSD